MGKNQKNEGFYDKYSVTIRADKIVTDTQKTAEYEEDDSLAIFKMLQEYLNPLDFSYYLKRYVYLKAGYKADFDTVPVDDYIKTIAEAFNSRGVPPTLKPTSTKLRAAIRNWLTQKSASRETVIMLGFALDMSLEEVDSFLTKALQESSLNPKNPIETICWYCFKNHLGFYHFKQLISKYDSLPGTADDKKDISRTGTSILRTEVADIKDEKTLLRYLNQLKMIDGKSRQSVDAKEIFDQLYDEACAAIARMNNDIEEARKEVELNRLKDKLSRTDRFSDEQKQILIRKYSEKNKQWTKEEISPADFEIVLYSAVPKDQNGNLIPMKKSLLNELFAGKRLNRQHIQKILDGSGMINRYDLTTMSFFVLSQRNEEEVDPVKRYNHFIYETNEILDKCGMGELYKANPYEAFLMICMLTDYPLGTFADVWELSYEETDNIER